MKRRAFLDALRKCRAGIGAVFLCFFFAGVVFRLYRLPAEPFLYAAGLILFIGILCFVLCFLRTLSKAKERARLLRAVLTEPSLPPAETQAEADYTEAIRQLQDAVKKCREDFDTRRREESDYYTAWVHQIKTPIAVMRMELGGREDEQSAVLENELFRIEQYVDMVLTYIRLGEDSRDLLVKEYPLDRLLREAIRKFAPQFVAKRLRLCYEGTDRLIVTDKKWFISILEQLLSNAIKYTPSGCITVALEGDRLTVSDTGIGIAPEDLPRIFEKGFTGENGRIEKRSSGLGLYLCRKIAALLAIPLSVESHVGEGSCFSLDLTGKLKDQ